MAANSMQQLSETLRQKQQQDAERIEAQTRQRLSEHDENLRQLASDSLAGAMAATASETKRMQRALIQHRKQVQSLTEELREAQSREVKRLAWLMKLPLLALLTVSLLALAGIWGFWEYQRPWTTEQIDGQQYQIMKEPGAGNWTTCEIEGRSYLCRPAEGGLIDSMRR